MAPPQAPATEVAQANQQAPQSWTGSLAGFVRMAVFWYFAMQIFGPKKVTNPDLLTSNLFIKGENLVVLYTYCLLLLDYLCAVLMMFRLYRNKAYNSLVALQFVYCFSKHHNVQFQRLDMSSFVTYLEYWWVKPFLIEATFSCNILW